MPEEKDPSANLETINLREKEPSAPDQGQERAASPEREPKLDKNQEKLDINEALVNDTKGGGEMAAGRISAGSDAERQKQIELVLAKDMQDLYLEMNEAKRREFKKFGEETASKISELASKGKATARKILDLIRKWLALIPGVNKYFLEQEAKIKTDEIMQLTNIDD